MILLASGTALHARFGDQPWLGQLVCPRGRHRIRLPQWAADNAAFGDRFDRTAYVRMLGRIVDHDITPLFVTVPDMVGDWRATLAAWREWRTVVRFAECPLAYVLQDGQPASEVPWDEAAAVFVGGHPAGTWKVGQGARDLIAEAKARGRWVHMGRVNTLRRVLYAQQVGCDSVDGSGFSRWPDDKLSRFTRVALHPTLPV